MKEIKICIGSSCHMRGAYTAIEQIKGLIEQHGLEEEVKASPSFCLNLCGTGVGIKRWDNQGYSLSLEELDSWFVTEILSQLQGGE